MHLQCAKRHSYLAFRIQMLQEAMGRAKVDLDEMKQKLIRSEEDVARKAAQALRAATVEGGAVAQLHALRTKVAGKRHGTMR